MFIRSFTAGLFRVNCYLIGCEKTRRAALIDPGDSGPDLLEQLELDSWQVDGIYLTHGHVDHIGAVAEVKEATGARVFVGAGDALLIKGAALQARLFGLSQPTAFRPDQLLRDNDQISVGEISGRVIATPGHSPGSVCYLFDGHLFAGDTLFCGSVGRTDLPGGSHEQLMESIRNRLLVFPDQVIVHPGHGSETTLGEERRSNPFLAV